jgi:hypothetical protein
LFVVAKPVAVKSPKWIDPKLEANPAGRVPVHSDWAPTVYLTMLAQYPAVHVVVKAGKLGRFKSGSPSEQDISTGVNDEAVKDRVQFSQEVWA